MPVATLKLIPGVDLEKTPTLNEAAVSDCDKIRYMPDRAGLGLVQKLGGWDKYYPNSMGAIPRALLPWQDLNSTKWVAAACAPSTTPGVGSPINVISNGSLEQLQPSKRQDNVAVDVTTSTVSNIVEIGDTGSNVSNFDAVFVATHISVGGVIVYGFYPCIASAANVFQVALYDLNSNPIYPTANDTNAGVVAVFDTTAGSIVVEVTLPDHGFQVGSVYPVMVQTSVGGVVLSGEYQVREVLDADTFTIYAAAEASSTDTVSINGGDARYNFYVGVGPPPTGSGYGVGGYGTGGYGSGTGSGGGVGTGSGVDTTDWCLDNWGSILLACPVELDFGAPDNVSRIGGPLYYWDPSAGTPTILPIGNGPVANDGFFVAMPQRQIVAWGSTFDSVQDPLLLRWCEVGNYNVWLASPLNRAGSFRLPRGSRIVSGLQLAQQGLILTDLGGWAMQYVGGDGVYSINEIGTDCGCIARKAVTRLSDDAFWMSQSQFFRTIGQGIEPVTCPVWDAIFQDLDRDNIGKIRAAANSRFSEVAFYYPSLSGGTGEVDKYVKWCVPLGDNGWDIGNLDRTAWYNQSVIGAPIGGDASGFIMQHEVSNDADGLAMHSWFETGYFAIAEGDFMAFVDMWWPDMKWGERGGTQNATVLFTFKIKTYPNDDPVVHGPYTVTQARKFFSPRFRDKLVSIRVESQDVGSFWRLGGNRFRVAPDGKFG